MVRRFKFQIAALFLAVAFSSAVFVQDAAAQRMIPSVGHGSVEVILFSDYFCPPCKRIDTQAESLLKELMATGGVKITFVDVPFHRETAFYNKYYLYAANANPGEKNIMHVRKKLFEAAQEKRILKEDELLAFLKKEKIALNPLDEKAIHPLMIALNKEYKVDQTPIGVIVRPATKPQRMVGTDEIWTGLTALKADLSKAKKEIR